MPQVRERQFERFDKRVDVRGGIMPELDNINFLQNLQGLKQDRTLAPGSNFIHLIIVVHNFDRGFPSHAELCHVLEREQAAFLRHEFVNPFRNRCRIKNVACGLQFFDTPARRFALGMDHHFYHAARSGWTNISPSSRGRRAAERVRQSPAIVDNRLDRRQCAWQAHDAPESRPPRAGLHPLSPRQRTWCRDWQAL